MPAVQAKAGIRLVAAVGAHDMRHTGVGGRELAVLLGGLVLEVVRAAEVVLGAGATDRRVAFAATLFHVSTNHATGQVAVEVELDLALAPPAVVVHLPCHVGADVVALALDTVKDRVYVLV